MRLTVITVSTAIFRDWRLLLRRNSPSRTVPQTPLAGSAANAVLCGDRLDLHNVAKFSEAFNQALFLLID